MGPMSRRHNGNVYGRFAPSPTGGLHVGNLRTALVAWLAARDAGRGFVIRMEDLDRVTSSAEHEAAQLADLADLGIESDVPVVRQSERFDTYRAAIRRLDEAGMVYRCYCTRREIRAELEAAASAPHEHLPDGAYPGTCRGLDPREEDRKREQGRVAALRLRAGAQVREVHDRRAGRWQGAVDDVVLARADGVPAYNLAVVVDDAAQRIDQVVRGDDLLTSTPRQILLQELLDLPQPEYLHVPLVLDAEGRRISKRAGAVTWGALRGQGWTARRTLSVLAGTLGLAAPGEQVDLEVLVDRFDPALIPSSPIDWTEVLRRS